MSNFYVVATPIGNLQDCTLRALDVLKNVDLVLAEDTRVTKKLLRYFKIKVPLLSYHQHSKLTRINYILKLLKEGKNLALVSDRGTPGICDPGNKLIEKIIESGNEEIKIIPVAGPSALTASASIAGFSMDKFLFLGFPPLKRKRKQFFKKIVNSVFPVIFYESPYRILNSLQQLYQTDLKLNNELTKKVVVCRELTKKFETIYRGKINEVIEEMKKGKIKGEFVVIVAEIKNIKKR